MIKSILPDFVVAVDMFTDPPDPMLFPEEEQVIAHADERRRQEFGTARVCAHDALRKLGVRPGPVLPGLRGEPQWPTGVVGSITHCAGYRGAVVATASKVTAIGIDAEPNEPLVPGVLDAVSLPEERESLAKLAARHPRVQWDRMLFSAKESVFKAWFPLAKRWLDFQDILVNVDPAGGEFTAWLRVGGPRVRGQRITAFSGRWVSDAGLVLTAVVLPAPGRAATSTGAGVRRSPVYGRVQHPTYSRSS
ncbi:4'-phosphopantetheinyl transferase [Sphaerisporangium melleum]|uniref:4'-phosphopantetheinyl transferase n=1 Tax=Sphaerisporangium melleum TaxID=321316 RepID=A0A917VPP1_9ACTN|nr:4'-phosphopantetheinyl transferase superfamily protein [Sphaerisporangium melleum]GGL05570.1 4'-phosphopantetheinyl transferase [Sphaerisporangium melleum]GII73191.1 4'-phosphopantetheinyl transferase [Sphaerisporangium melleum]